MRTVILLAFIAAVSAVEQPMTWTAAGELVMAVDIGGKPALMIIDSGATHSVLDAAFCERGKIRTRAVRGTTTTIDGERQGVRMAVDPPAIAGWREFTVIDLSVRGGDDGAAVVGILGLDYLRAAKATLDFGKGVIALPDPADGDR
ncbi:MAG TPA: retropepsin-like aspartic protease [Planctomycetota bacterium]|nr:retropepsin-like aspartic protease [Planctomycetota bacterium]